MSCPYCHPQDTSLARSYNIENVHGRFNPTYYHTQIFTPGEGDINHKIRCTPTFHSQIMYHAPPNKKTIKNVHYQPTPSTKEVVYKNLSKGTKQDQFYNKRGNCCYKSDQLWYDSSKADTFKRLECLKANYAHERKQIDLGSNPVFGGATIDVCEVEQQKNVAQDCTIEQNRAQKTNCNYNGSENPVQVDDNDLQSESSVESIRRQAQIQTDPQENKQLNSNNGTQTATFMPKKKQVKKVNAFNRTVIEGRPTFTIVRKRDW